MNPSTGQDQPTSSPPIPTFEQLRLEELHSLAILDTAFEDRFDRYTSLLSSLYEFPICLVTLVDDDRQWFKSAHGLDFRETKRDRSFCAHALTHNDVFVVPDTAVDTRFSNNPLVTGPPYIRFYAGAVIHGPNGLPLGTLCLLDHKLREFDERDRKHLRQFADLVEHEILHNHEVQDIRMAARYAAYCDALTDLPNWRLFDDRLNQFVRLADTQADVSFTVLHIDVVDFLRVNRSLGREAGDVVLCELADRLRRMCPAEGTVARLHADRFAMVTPRSQYDEQEPGQLVCQLARGLSRPILIGDREHFLRLRIGASHYEGPQDTAEVLLERAAGAARSPGNQLGDGVSVHFHDDRMEVDLERKFELESRIRSALEHEQFHLEYQPVCDVSGRRVVSLEALLRWHEPTLGDIAPDEFIPLAESTGVIIPLGKWVLSEALRQYREWDGDGSKPLPIHVNLSAREVEQPEFVERVNDLLDRAEVPGEALCLEITETVLMHDLGSTAARMALLTERGVRFYIDDFGKGYSSLRYLRHLPVTALKIDRSFVGNVTRTASDASIARAVIALARTLGVTVIAEGVETEEQLDFLRREGCELAQGFLLGKPASAAAARAVFADR